MMLIWNNIEENHDFKNAHFLSETIVIHFIILFSIVLGQPTGNVDSTNPGANSFTQLVLS